MARYYDVTFDTPSGRITVRGYGNTKRSAERSARGKLRRDHGLDPQKCWAVNFEFVPEGER